MYLIYGIIGITLIIVGVTYLCIFLKYFVRTKDRTDLIIAVSEALITVIIGVFYIYSVAVLASKSETNPVNFTNNIDDILLKNDSFEYYFTTKEPETMTEVNELHTEIENMDEENDKEMTTTEYDTLKTTSQDTNTSMYTEETFSTKTTLPMEINKTEQFIKKYQTFIREIIKQKLSNSSILNQTLANIKFGPSKPKISREIKFQLDDVTCSYNFFLENALLLYSFIHCLLSLVGNTLQCSKCITIEEESKEESHDSESSIESKTVEVLDTSGSASAPVGPLFESSKSTNNGPDLKLFQAKSVQPRSSSKAKINVIDVPQTIGKYKLSMQILLTWLLPITVVIILYYSSRTERSLPNFEQIKLRSNFSVTPVDSNITNLIHNPNVKTNSPEIDSIVSKVYNIVNEAKEQVMKKTTYLTPVMVDVLYFTPNTPKDPKHSNCFTTNYFLKVLYFFIFVVSYCGVIFFAKITEIFVKFKNEDMAKKQNMHILSFVLLWLPSVLEFLYRIFVSQGSSTVVFGIFLLLGNMNRIQTMMYNHLNIKKCTTKSNFVNPA